MGKSMVSGDDFPQQNNQLNSNLGSDLTWGIAPIMSVLDLGDV